MDIEAPRKSTRPKKEAPPPAELATTPANPVPGFAAEQPPKKKTTKLKRDLVDEAAALRRELLEAKLAVERAEERAMKKLQKQQADTLVAREKERQTQEAAKEAKKNDEPRPPPVKEPAPVQAEAPAPEPREPIIRGIPLSKYSTLSRNLMGYK